jgi:AcrR family transcriptional regulator
VRTAPAREPEAPDRPASKRRRILLAAREVCARAGYDAARMDEIAALARVSKGTLYNFFDSKEELFLCTVLDAHEGWARLLGSEPGPDAPPERRLRRWIDSLVSSLPAVSAGMTVNFQVWGVIARDDRARARLFGALREFYAGRRESLRQLLEDGVRQGVFRSDLDCDSFVEAFFALFDGFAYRSTFEPLHAHPGALRGCLEGLVATARADPRAGARGEDG